MISDRYRPVIDGDVLALGASTEPEGLNASSRLTLRDTIGSGADDVNWEFQVTEDETVNNPRGLVDALDSIHPCV